MSCCNAILGLSRMSAICYCVYWRHCHDVTCLHNECHMRLLILVTTHTTPPPTCTRQRPCSGRAGWLLLVGAWPCCGSCTLPGPRCCCTNGDGDDSASPILLGSSTPGGSTYSACNSYCERDCCSTAFSSNTISRSHLRRDKAVISHHES